MRLKRVLLPAPLGPTTPTRSPTRMRKEALTSTSCSPKCLDTSRNSIMGGEGRVIAGKEESRPGLTFQWSLSTGFV